MSNTEKSGDSGRPKLSATKYVDLFPVRVIAESASRVLGYRKNWSGRVLNRSGRTVKALQGIGFSAKTEKLAAQSKQGNWVNSNTISLDDFNRTIVYAVSDKKNLL